MHGRAISILVVASLLGGCVIQETIKPVQLSGTRDICIVDNPRVKSGFLDAYQRALTAKGYTPKQLPASSAITDCQVTSTYTANWRWDLAMYMAYAEITVFEGGKVAGKATYDSTRGGANMGKFINADRKIGDLVDKLFPHTAGL